MPAFSVREMEPAADWASLSDEELLERRISKLGLRLEDTPLQPLIQQLYNELSAKGLAFHPPAHIGDEWFVPIGIPAIFVPFFLVHDRLRSLEQLVQGVPLFPPIEGLDESIWKKNCNACHKWDRRTLCEQGATYIKDPKMALRGSHPYGGPEKVAIMQWAKTGCQ